MRRRVRPAFLGIGLAFVLAELLPTSAYAHGFGERYDLPVPLWLYIGGAGAAIALSFAVIGLFVRGTPAVDGYPRLNLLRWRVGRALIHPLFVTPIQISSVALFVLVVVAGIVGDRGPTNNVAPTVVWVLWWVGLAYVSALVGDIWSLINPWKVTYGWVEALYRRLDLGEDLSLYLRYPDRLGVWPGLLLFVGFAWVEIVYADSAVPLRIAQMAVAYSLVTWGGMLLFGKETWLRHGEIFTLVFGLLARFAPTEIRVNDGEVCADCEIECRDSDDHCVGCSDCFNSASAEHQELNLRPFAVGLLRGEAVSTPMMAFVVLLLSTLTFDGFTATPVWVDGVDALYGPLPNLTAIGTIGLLAFPALFIFTYLLVAALMTVASGRRLPAGDMARAFVYSLVPIALAYHLAHFFSFLLIQGQFIIPLASDPFGFGWDLFGTADFRVNIAIVNARFAWFTAVTAIVTGHIIAVYLAHVIALRVLTEHRPALRSQYPMLALMVGYTMLSLWILAQPIVESAPKREALPTAASPSVDVTASPVQAATVAPTGITAPTSTPGSAPISPTQAPTVAPSSATAPTSVPDSTSLPPPPTAAATSPPIATADPSVGGQSGKLVHNTEGVVQVEHYQVGVGDRSHTSEEGHPHLDVSNFIASVTFVNPYPTEDGNWDYGLLFRRSGTNTFHAIGLTSDGKWYHRVRTGSPESGRLMGVGAASTAELAFGGSNRIDLWASGASGSLYINGSLAVRLDLSRLTTSGDIAVSTGLFGSDVAGRSTDFTGFIVSPL